MYQKSMSDMPYITQNVGLDFFKSYFILTGGVVLSFSKTKQIYYGLNNPDRMSIKFRLKTNKTEFFQLY